MLQDSQIEEERHYYPLKHRTFIMGIATLLVMFYHAELILSNDSLRIFKCYCYGGVDIFIFTSGYGCCQSYLNQKNAFDFWLRRVKKVFPIWFPFVCLVWAPCFLYKTNELNKGIFARIIGNILGIQVFTENGNVFCWYIGVMYITYLLTPMFVELINRKGIKISLFLFPFLFVLTIPFWKTEYLIMIFTRLPVFLIGILGGYICTKTARLNYSRKYLISLVLIIIMIFGCLLLRKLNERFENQTMWDYGLFWYPFVFIVPGSIVLLSSFAKIIIVLKQEWIYNIISKIGTVSFEIYLLHVMMKRVIDYMIEIDVLDNSNMLWLVSFTVAVVIAPGLTVVGKRLRKLVFRG